VPWQILGSVLAIVTMFAKTELSTSGLQGTRVSGDDVVIGKTAPVPVDNTTGEAVRFTKRDCSTKLKHTENGMIDQVSVQPE
jgi:DNA-directed RNA polymerase beta subunit